MRVKTKGNILIVDVDLHEHLLEEDPALPGGELGLSPGVSVSPRPRLPLLLRVALGGDQVKEEVETLDKGGRHTGCRHHLNKLFSS